MSDESDEDNETRPLNIGGRVFQKITTEDYSSLIALDCLWVADYGMRNTGDLETVADLYPTFLNDGKAAAQELPLPCTADAFSLSHR